MSNRINSKNPNNTNTNHNGLAEQNITGDNMNEYKNALDHNNSYISGTSGGSSSSHQFTDNEESQS